MRAELKRLHSPDVPNLVSWAPENKEFSILVQILVGPERSPGEESFDVTVCTPGWLSWRLEQEKVINARHHLIVAKYDYSQLSNYLRTYVSSCEGETWQEVAHQLSRLGYWEFEDYVE